MTTADDLRAVRALVADRYTYHRIGMVGAVDRVHPMKSHANRACVKALQEAARSDDPTDWSSHRSALRRLDRAIAASESP